MWFGIGWRFGAIKAVAVLGFSIAFTYLWGWVKGKEAAEKEKKHESISSS